LDRAIGPSFIARRVELHGVVQDERLTKRIVGVDVSRPRHRLLAVVRGECLSDVDGRTVTLAAGDVLFVP
jgi:mannose-6-phosphate isomerase-like protein (cupin superfamily)